jgi:hypothetical protein
MGLDGEEMEEQIRHDHFELDVYGALAPLGAPFNYGPLHHRDPKKSAVDGILTPNQGRRLFLFEKLAGETFHYGHWRALDAQQKVGITC